MTVQEQTVQRSADAAAAVAIAGASLGWLTALNDVLQVIASAVAIVSGCLAGYYYWTKTRRKDNND